MSIKNISNVYNLLLSLGAFYLGVTMLSGEGVFETFPPEWVGRMPFNSWESLAIMGMVIFGVGNAVISLYGFMKKDHKLFILTFTWGLLLFLSAIMPIMLIGEWYLPALQIWLLSLMQLILGFIGIVSKRFNKKKQLKF
ncbi:hypothetical protein [Alkalibacillus almallahensis]|uniref:hypothetical protein n=1 Tax=Alkalibacillus almallahensis TaxID=1379154 RepID=UPI001421E059|nr:hypothetical protein [Alkalibacillus almallahensis]NIK12601.1 hypothetical protein [Alkalibacillus almallahensis]